MFGEIYSHVQALLPLQNWSRGRTTFVSALTGASILLFVSFLTYFEIGIPVAVADNVTTSVTVLNTPPVWDNPAEENLASSTSTPTNSGGQIFWVARATDSNAENYYLLICKTGTAATANSSAPPTCAGGVSNQWAISSSTASGSWASAATTTKETFPFDQEKNDWWAFVCDANASLPRCNLTAYQGNGDDTKASPFVINHPPVFTAIANDGPEDPGGTVTWTSTAYDNDSLGGSNDTIRLVVCKAATYSTTTNSCGVAGAWATSTLQTSDPATTTPIAIPSQDKNYAAYVYIVDEHNHAATSTIQATNSQFFVNNVAPGVTASSISFEDTDNVGNVVLTVPSGTSGPFYVKFTATDNNSCLNASSTNEFSSAVANIFRSGVASTSCYASGHYNANNCYTNASPYFSGHISCSQDGGTCSGATDSDATWTCTLDLWFNADPTDASTPWTAENWLSTVEVTDDDTATSSLIEAETGNDVTSFMAFDVTETAIGYGGLEPGQASTNLGSTTDLRAVGNVGLDEDLYGDTMCTTWTTADSCDTNGISATNDIPVDNQRFATSGVAFAQGTQLTGSSSPSELLIRVPKTTATASPESLDTYWGINIPGTITLAGDYSGQNTITAKVSNFLFW